MTVTDRTAATDAEFRSRIAPVESAPTPPEVVEARVVEEVARAMFAAAHPSEDWLTGYPEDMRKYFRRLAAAAVAAYRAAQDGGAEEIVCPCGLPQPHPADGSRCWHPAVHGRYDIAVGGGAQ